MTPALQVSLGKLHLPNPVMVAAGTFGYGLEYRDWVDLAQTRRGGDQEPDARAAHGQSAPARGGDACRDAKRYRATE
jgi:hypothetical protein